VCGAARAAGAALQSGGRAWVRLLAETRRAPQVRDAGGLRVVLASMQETARGENQLRGRAGRQGDPGESLALFDLEDRLLAEAGVVAQVNALLGPALAGARAPVIP